MPTNETASSFAACVTLPQPPLTACSGTARLIGSAKSSDESFCVASCNLNPEQNLTFDNLPGFDDV